jgi:hypothetical protein
MIKERFITYYRVSRDRRGRSSLWTARQISMALWNVEAAACDKALDWPLGREIRRCAYRADLLSCGVPEDQHEALYIWVIRENSALTCARQAAWRSARVS